MNHLNNDKNGVLNRLIKHVKQEIRVFLDSFSFISGNIYYSQLAEDAILAKYFYRTKKGKHSRLDRLLGREKMQVGFYIDIGAFSPKKWSNTYYFYKSGWQGITVEPNPDASRWFRMLRPRDQHICAAISEDENKVFYYSGGYSSRNFISKDNVEKNGFEKSEIQGLSLRSLFEKFVPEKQKVDLLSVDCEGYDLNVLKSNDWTRFRPSVVVAETGPETELARFLKDQRYEVFAWTIGSVLFKEVDGVG
jgi:FkbM family methyltransferase